MANALMATTIVTIELAVMRGATQTSTRALICFVTRDALMATFLMSSMNAKPAREKDARMGYFTS